MSVQTSPAPLLGQIDESKLPSGHCRYIMMQPELRGQRCGCVGFTLNRTLPGVSCDCGHLSCYHIREVEQPPGRIQLEQLLRRIKLLEEQLDHEKQGGLGNALGGVVRRLGDLEEQLEKSREEISQETRGIYRQITRVWQSVDQVGRQQAQAENRHVVYDERLDVHDNNLHQLGDRMMECDEAVIDLEDRIDQLEDENIPLSRRRRMASSESQESRMLTPIVSERHARHESPNIASVSTSVSYPVDVPRFASPAGSNHSSSVTVPWTAHVSLLPTASQPFPFEKDTNAYKRCLSRGLHRMVVVPGTDSDSFVEAVSEHFASLLHGRSWVPLQARLCDAETLLGLPMLRPMDPSLVGVANYDIEFLREHCAVVGPNGKIDSLYIAMEDDTFSWHFLRSAPCYKPGLEDAWAYDPLLDPNYPSEDDEMDEEDRPSAGDIVTSLPGTLKRTSSNITRSPSLSSGSSGEGESSQKVPRTSCIPVPIELRRRVETV